MRRGLASASSLAERDAGGSLACHEGNLGLAGILAGARAQEKK